MPPEFSQLDQRQIDSIALSFELLACFSDPKTAPQTKITDYSFMVFPMAKAYEGFLKDYLLKANLLSQETYHSKKFRIGRALNPDVFPNHQDEQWLFDDVSNRLGHDVARRIWDTWLQCRNHVFHYFPEDRSSLSLSEAQECLTILRDTMMAVLQTETARTK